jgi:hypothetical protein
VLISRSPKRGFAGPPDDPFHEPPIKRNAPAATDDTRENKSFHAGSPKGHKRELWPRLNGHVTWKR